MNTASHRKVRRATPSDAHALAELRYEFRATERIAVEPRDQFVSRAAAWMQDRLANPDQWRAWLLEMDGSPAGAIWLQIIEKIPNPSMERERHGYVTNFFIRAISRGQGAGSELLSVLVQDCASLSIDTIFLWPSDRSRPLYARHGFVSGERLLILEH